MTNEAVICLGANGDDAYIQVKRAFRLIGNMGKILRATHPYLSEPEFSCDSAPYLNQIIILSTDTCLKDLLKTTKAYQTLTRAEAGITPFVAIDIDIVAWNGDILRPSDARARYFRKGWDMLGLTNLRKSRFTAS